MLHNLQLNEADANVTDDPVTYSNIYSTLFTISGRELTSTSAVDGKPAWRAASRQTTNRPIDPLLIMTHDLYV